MASSTIQKPSFLGIDTTNVLVSDITTTWTATENCWLVVTMETSGTNCRTDISIDGVTVAEFYCYNSITTARSAAFPIIKGQVIKRVTNAGSGITLRVYGLKS